MPAFNRYLAAYAAVLLAIATGLGAYASHGLAGVVAADSLRTLEIGIDYQFFHALGLLVLAVLTNRAEESLALRAATLAIAVGVVVFCGGMYASGLGGPRVIAHAAPFGGTLLIIGWLAVGTILIATGRRPGG